MDFFTRFRNDIIRSSFCADGVRSGTRVALIRDRGSFLVSTRFQIIGRRHSLDQAVTLFEDTVYG